MSLRSLIQLSPKRAATVCLYVLFSSATARSQTTAEQPGQVIPTAGVDSRTEALAVGADKDPDQSLIANRKPMVRNLNNLRFSGHSVALQPKFVEVGASGGTRIKDHLDIGGYLNFTPHTRGFGGTHYGEIKTAMRLVKRNGFIFGPAHEHVTLTYVKDYEKLGVAGKFRLSKASFDYELFPYTAVKKRGNVGVFYYVPLGHELAVSGFFDYMVFAPSRPKVAQINLRRTLSYGFEFLIEYFHNDFSPPKERNKVSAGIGYNFP